MTERRGLFPSVVRLRVFHLSPGAREEGRFRSLGGVFNSFSYYKQAI